MEESPHMQDISSTCTAFTPRSRPFRFGSNSSVTVRCSPCQTLKFGCALDLPDGPNALPFPRETCYKSGLASHYPSLGGGAQGRQDHNGTRLRSAARFVDTESHGAELTCRVTINAVARSLFTRTDRLLSEKYAKGEFAYSVKGVCGPSRTTGQLSLCRS